jgi:MFS family permease
MSSFYLLKTKRFAPLFVVQFLGAFNDNIFKNTLAILVTFHASAWTSLPLGILAPLIGAIFILPFFIFSGLVGALADKYDKATLTRLVKLLEFGLMSIATLGFYMHGFSLLLVVVFGMGLHSTLFGPIKYAIIPQHMSENELVMANALVESGTFGAILLGTLGGGLIAASEYGGIIAGIMGMVIALIGYVCSRYIPTAPSLNEQMSLSYNIFAQTAQTLKLAYANKTVFFSIIAISWFWLYGALLLSQFPAFVKVVLVGDETTVTLLLSLFTIGIGVGSFLCEKLSHHTIRPSLIILGALGMAFFGIDFALTSSSFVPVEALFSSSTFWHILIDLTLIALFGGLGSVPAFRSRIIAANNILNALFMVLGAVLTMVLLDASWRIPEVFLSAAIGTGLIATWIAWVLYKRID